MIKQLILAMVILLGFSTYAMAQSSSGSSANSGATASTSSGAASQATLVQNNNGQGDYTLKNVPAVSAPGVITAHNCALGASVGAAGAGFGLSLGGSYVDDECQRMSEAAALNTLVGAKVAVRHLAAGSPDICKTLRSTNHIPATSICSEDERRDAARASRTKPNVMVASDTSQRPEARPALYRKCVLTENNTIKIRYAPGVDKSAAKLACQASLGY